MFRKHTKATNRVTVYRPHILDTGRSKLLAKPETVVAPVSTIPEVVGDVATIIALALTVALVVMAGTMSQTVSPRSHLVTDTIYSPGTLVHSFMPVRKALPRPHHSILPKLRPAPVTIQTQPSGSCTGKTIMNIVAHEDDDLLFINPAISHDLADHDCVRTIYVTAGDDGRGATYLHQREAGSQAAYSVMLHSHPKTWNYQSVPLPSGTTIVAASPEDNQDVSLVFLRLPDGNLNGEGFAATDYQSIARLKSGEISSITSVDRDQAFTSSQLVDVLIGLMEQYQPISINTQADDSTPLVADHSDHVATGEYATLAAAAYTQQTQRQVAIRYFMGYPIRAMLPNISAADVAQKSAAFFAYAAHDPGVCMSLQACVTTHSSYGFYLQRQYLGANQ